MDIGEWIKSFVIDAWYKAFILVGAGLFVLSLSIDVKGMSNGQLQLLSGGLFLIGLGVWKNEKEVSWFKPPNVYTGPAALMSTTIRRVDIVGLIFEIIGGILIFAFVVTLFFGSRRADQKPAPIPAHPTQATPNQTNLLAHSVEISRLAKIAIRARMVVRRYRHDDHEHFIARRNEGIHRNPDVAGRLCVR